MQIINSRPLPKRSQKEKAMKMALKGMRDVMNPPSLQEELNNAVRQGKFHDYVDRAEKESELLSFANSVDWDRTKVIEWLIENVTGWIDNEFLRPRFEKSFDNGQMKKCAEAYHNALCLWNQSDYEDDFGSDNDWDDWGPYSDTPKN